VGNLQDIEFHVLHVWSASRLRAASVDAAKKAVIFTKVRPFNAGWSDFRNRRYWAENVKEAFGAPGEWYLDPHGHAPLHAAARRDARQRARRSAAPHAASGAPRHGRAAAREHDARRARLPDSQWVTPQEGNFTPQGEMNIPAAVEVVGARGVSVRRCVFTQLGGYAMAFGPGAHSNAVDRCLMTDLGAGGVKIGPPYVGYLSTESAKDVFDTAQPDGLGKTTSAITVSNCRIAGGGRIHPAGHGVWIGSPPTTAS
jgi:hypothetical protein